MIGCLFDEESALALLVGCIGATIITLMIILIQHFYEKERGFK